MIYINTTTYTGQHNPEYFHNSKNVWLLVADNTLSVYLGVDLHRDVAQRQRSGRISYHLYCIDMECFACFSNLDRTSFYRGARTCCTDSSRLHSSHRLDERLLYNDGASLTLALQLDVYPVRVPVAYLQ